MCINIKTSHTFYLAVHNFTVGEHLVTDIRFFEFNKSALEIVKKTMLVVSLEEKLKEENKQAFV